MSPATAAPAASTRLEIVGQVPGELAALVDRPTERERLLLVVGGTVEAAADGGPADWPALAERTGEALARIHATLQTFVAPEGELLSGQRIVVLVDEAAVLGDPDQPGESTVAGAVVPLVRTLAMELRRRGSCVNLILGTTIERAGTGGSTPVDDVSAAADALLRCRPDTTGEEIHLAAGSHLGRVRP